MKRRVDNLTRTRRSWLVPSFLFSVLVVIALAAIWQKSRDPSSGDSNLVAEVGLLTDEGIRSTVTVTELERIRSSLQSQYSAADRTNKIRLLKLRIATDDRGLEIAKSKSQHKSFQLDQMRILKVLCWMERKNQSVFRETEQRARDLAMSFLDDTDQELASEAQRCNVVLAGLGVIRSPASPEAVGEFKNAIEMAAGKFTDNEDIVADVRLLLDDLFRDERTGFEVFDLMRFISEKYKNSNQKAIRDWSAMVWDQSFFAEKDFFYREYLCEQGREFGFDATLDSVPWLLSKNLSPFGIKRLLTVANVFESKSKFDHAKRLFRIILDWVDSSDNRPEMEEIRLACQLGLRRVESVGSPFKIEGVDVKNNPLKTEDYTAKVVLILFVGDEKDLEKVKNRIAELESLEKHGLKIVIVGLGFDSTELLAVVGTKSDSVVSWIADKNRSGSLIAQCPAVILPYGMIVDRNGNVAKLAVYGNGLQQTLESMVFD